MPTAPICNSNSVGNSVKCFLFYGSSPCIYRRQSCFTYNIELTFYAVRVDLASRWWKVLLVLRIGPKAVSKLPWQLRNCGKLPRKHWCTWFRVRHRLLKELRPNVSTCLLSQTAPVRFPIPSEIFRRLNPEINQTIHINFWQ